MRQQCLTASGRTDEKNIGLGQFDVVKGHPCIDALIVVVNGNRKALFGPVLTDDILVQDRFNLGRFGEFAQTLPFFFLPFLRDDVVAQLDTLIADVDRGTGDQLPDVILTFSAKGASEFPPAFYRFGHLLFPLAFQTSTAKYCVARRAWLSASVMLPGT
ncbi:protein of unknown function [Candidatus Methylomirabilis oxygeniifera]|uniref:Uncharacterized protein n=1 Tax=Methylomirabilis oxygeniifera TaxID=671143 RepID=D5MHT9_METO1|nr:protein of unknown function [Candidatus Methylomirabilis oxyfera]